MTNPDIEELIAAWLDGRISQSDTQSLQQHLRESADARKKFREYAELDAALREIAGGDLQSAIDVNQLPEKNLARHTAATEPKGFGVRYIPLAAIAASLLVAIGGIAYQLGKNDSPIPAGPVTEATPVEINEQTMAGYATLRRMAGIQWPEQATAFRAGDVLPAGELEFDSGVAEIDFFCGATLIVEGPAKMELESDWSVRLLHGRLRATVPPAARGFIVKAADSEIIDLGTEFALEVNPENARVEVVEGEVKLRGGKHDGTHLVTGQGQSLIGISEDVLGELSSISDVQRRHAAETEQRFNEWLTYSNQLRQDDRLIAYYPIAKSRTERVLPNAAATGKPMDGTLVGLVHQAAGRFGPLSNSVGFDRPGSRVRTRIDGEFDALTFACWVKIDSLENVYNALFMGDGYENGEPHWQIRDDGCLMFSVMVDETQDVRIKNRFDQQVVRDAGLHRVYFTQPIWDITKRGQWLHIAAVYDPDNRRVVQYVNGREVSNDSIIEKFHVEKLRIGPAELGNWGQPFRNSPWFAVRNLNGAIDELAIFDAALNSEEIRQLFELGKPLGY